MLSPKHFKMVAFALRRDLYQRLEQQYPNYGDISKLMRWLVQQVVEGKVKPSLSK